MSQANAVINTASLIFYDTSANTEKIEANEDKTMNVTICGRKLYKDGNWNTLCLPFNVTSEQINAQDGDNNYTSPLHGATIMELDVEGKYDADGNPDANGSYQTSFASDGTLYLYFKSTTEGIKAGKPYIIKWADDDDIVNPTFSGVTINSNSPEAITSKDGNISFIGNYDPVYTDEYGDATKLYLGAGNKLYYPSGIRAINAFRAYFQLNNGITAGEPKSGQQHVRAFYLNFDDDPTGITTTDYMDYTDKDGAWYGLDGRKYSAKPTAKGLYINKGKKVVIK
jgi:hypothetical protein